MGELEERLEAVLNDPQQMERITRMASSLMGSMGADGSGEGSSGREDPGHTLLRSLSPFLAPERQGRLSRALHIAAAVRLAGAAMGEWGGGG